MGGKIYDITCKTLVWRLLCVAFIILHSSFFTSCRQEDDIIKVVPARHWVEKKVAVVAPIGNASTKTRLERTAQWFLENLIRAQRYDTLAVNLQLEWYDELSADSSSHRSRRALTLCG